MKRQIVVAAAAFAAVITCAGCASVSRVGTGSGAASDRPVGVAPTGPASAASSSPDTSVSGPAIFVPPSGPAATAARDTPPPAGKQAVAKVGTVSISCPDDAYVSGGAPGRAALPADTTIKMVVRCETVLRAYPGLGEWSVQLAEVADSAPGLSQLADELRKPSEPTPPNIACAAYLAITPWFAVIDDHGRVLEPSMPTDECGQYLPSVGKALAALEYRAVDAVRVAQTRAPESLETGCDQHWKDMVAVEGARHPEGLKGADHSSIADPAPPSPSVLVCLYDVGSMDGDIGVGQLVKGATVTGNAAATLVSEAARAEPLPAGCPQAEKFAVIAGGAYLELGGCDRVLTSDGRLGSASPELVAQVQAALGSS
jgi:hypothetical protein